MSKKETNKTMMEERKEIQDLRMDLETLKRSQAEMKTVKAEITKEIKSSLEINENENRVSVERLLTGESAAQNDSIRDEEKSATVMEAPYRRSCRPESPHYTSSKGCNSLRATYR